MVRAVMMHVRSWREGDFRQRKGNVRVAPLSVVFSAHSRQRTLLQIGVLAVMGQRAIERHDQEPQHRKADGDSLNRSSWLTADAGTQNLRYNTSD